MAKHLIMDHTGHTVIEFDKADDVAVQQAMDRFHQLVSEQKHTAATRKAGASDYTMIKSPEDQQDETLFIPQMRGG